MTTAERGGLIVVTEVERRQSGPVASVAPNGSSRSTDYWTLIVKRQDWTDDPRNGIYAGRSYRIEERWISSDPDYLGQISSSSSQPWRD